MSHQDESDDLSPDDSVQPALGYHIGAFSRKFSHPRIPDHVDESSALRENSLK
jgi:hypothetical protein